MLKDREEAGKRLAARMEQYRARDAAVFALPRGGVPVACEIAKALGAPLDILPVRKVGHPHNPEYAVCATDEAGTLLCNEVERQSIDPEWMMRAIIAEQEEARRRAHAYRQGRVPLTVVGKTVVIVDDGAATGLTLRLALQRVRTDGAKELVAAVPVLPAALLAQLESEGVMVEALDAPVLVA